MRRASLLALAVLLASACKCDRETDAERAAKERAAMDQALRKSLALFPYRLLKMSLRSAGAPNRPEALDVVAQVAAETRALPAQATGAVELAKEAATYAKLFAALYAARKTMMDRDEDEFPTLVAGFLGSALPAPFDPQLEHLALAVIWFVVDASDRAKPAGSAEYVFYELSRAAPQPGWPAAVKRFAELMRGLSFCSADYHYAAEEELSAYLNAMATATPADLEPWNDPQISAAQALGFLRAGGYFGRAWNRLGLKRRDAAADDLEQGLAELDKLGVDNELTQWGWAVVHAHRGRYAEAAAKLDQLAASPHLEEKTRRELTEAAAEMRSHGKGIPVLLETRAMLIVASAMLSRAGGLDGVMAALLGEQQGKELSARLNWLERARNQLAKVGHWSVTE